MTVFRSRWVGIGVRVVPMVWVVCVGACDWKSPRRMSMESGYLLWMMVLAMRKLFITDSLDECCTSYTLTMVT